MKLNHAELVHNLEELIDFRTNPALYPLLDALHSVCSDRTALLRILVPQRPRQIELWEKLTDLVSVASRQVLLTELKGK